MRGAETRQLAPPCWNWCGRRAVAASVPQQRRRVGVDVDEARVAGQPELAEELADARLPEALAVAERGEDDDAVAGRRRDAPPLRPQGLLEERAHLAHERERDARAERQVGVREGRRRRRRAAAAGVAVAQRVADDAVHVRRGPEAVSRGGEEQDWQESTASATAHSISPSGLLPFKVNSALAKQAAEFAAEAHDIVLRHASLVSSLHCAAAASRAAARARGGRGHPAMLCQ